MENSFIPTPLGAPALMVLASTAENHEGARMPAPTHFANPDNKEGPAPPFSTANFSMYRPGEQFTAPLYSPLHPFVRQGLDRVGRSGVAGMSQAGSSLFRPVATDSSELYHSAFSPAKRAKTVELSTSGFPLNSGINDESLAEEECREVESKEERPSSLSSMNYDTNSETHSDAGDAERGTPDSEGRLLRKQRKKLVLDGQTPHCPICGLTLRLGEAESHLQQELEKLDKLSRTGRKSREWTPQGRKTLTSPMSGRRSKDGSPSLEAISRARHENYLRVQCNRQARLSARSRNRKKKLVEETTCPICNQRVTGTAEELNEHVELCLKKRDNLEDEPVDIDGDDSGQFEEYTWAGQTRVRATSMLDGGFAGSGFQVASTSRKQQDDDCDLNVDVDDSEQYGPPQYSEVDVMPCSSDEPGEDKERRALRGAVLSVSDSPYPSGHTYSEIEGAHNLELNGDRVATCPIKAEKDDTESVSIGGSAGEIIMALQNKLKDRQTDTTKNKCLICMEAYRIAVTSIQCWHVHCEECWLKTLGAKKLCPQCNMITSPGDLRRIYL